MRLLNESHNESLLLNPADAVAVATLFRGVDNDFRENTEDLAEIAEHGTHFTDQLSEDFVPPLDEISTGLAALTLARAYKGSAEQEYRYTGNAEWFIRILDGLSAPRIPSLAPHLGLSVKSYTQRQLSRITENSHSA